MLKNKTWPYLLLILLLAIVLRFFKLAQVPHGMTVDEAAIGYNGFAIFTVHRDEWLEKMPISFRSFGDYKAPAAIYLNGLFTALFGMNLWAVRLPFAIFSIAAILGIFLLGLELFYQKQSTNFLALILAFLLTVSPWHLHYSRLGFESGIALSLAIWAVYLLLRYIRQEKISLLILATILAVANLYVYHSAKLVMPLLIGSIILLDWQFFSKKIKQIWPVGILAIVLAAPLVYDAFFQNGLSRAGATLFAKNLGFFASAKLLMANFLDHFSLQFLIAGENNAVLRHGDGRFGVLSYPSLVLIVFYLIKVIKSSWQNKRIVADPLLKFALIWIFLGTLPAIIGSQSFHSNRAFLALPGFLILVTLAIENFLSNLKWPQKQSIVLILASYLIFLLLYQKNYYQNYAKISADDFKDGYLEAFQYLKEIDKSQLDKIIFANDYEHAYIYALFSFELSPIAYQGGILNIFEFNENIDASYLGREKTIVVASENDPMGKAKPDHVIYGSDGSERFRIYLP